MEFKVISLPPFKAVSSGVDREVDFSPEGILGKFDQFFSKHKPRPEDAFRPRDFLYYDPIQQGFVWIYALTDDVVNEGFDEFDFDGGHYLTFVYIDGDEKEGESLRKKALEWIEDSEHFELDERPDHYTMGHIINPPEVIKAQGYAQMETFIPIKLMKENN